MEAVITGVAEVVSDPVDSRDSLESMIFAAASSALADAGLERGDLDGIVLAASDQVDGRAISSMLTSGPAGAYLNEEINVASSPGHALVLAWLQVLSGTHERLLVTTWGKSSESAGRGTEPAERLSADPFFERDGGLLAISARALQAVAHRAAAPDAELAAEAAARVAARNHGNGVTAEDVRSSAVVAHPLRERESAPEIDGTFSIVVERAGRPSGAPVALRGAGWCSDAARVAERDLVGVPHLVRAARDAYERAGIGDARREVDVWELHDYTADAEIIAYAPLGLADSGGALALALDGDGAAINPSGGSLAGEAPFGGPMRKVVRAVRQVRGDGGDVQVPGATCAVAQISTGFAGQFQSVFVLGAAQ